MKYLTVTAKHHDGFGLWDSAVSEYDLGSLLDMERDIMKELSDACYDSTFVRLPSFFELFDVWSDYWIESGSRGGGHK